MRMLGSCMVRLSTMPCSPSSKPLSPVKTMSVLSSSPGLAKRLVEPAHAVVDRQDRAP